MRIYTSVCLVLLISNNKEQGKSIAFVNVGADGNKNIYSRGSYLAAYGSDHFKIEVVYTDDGAELYLTNVKAWTHNSISVLQAVNGDNAKIDFLSDKIGVSDLTPDRTIS